MTTSRYPIYAAWAYEILTPGTRSMQDVDSSLRNGHPVLDIFAALEAAASIHDQKFGKIAFDGVVGDDFLQVAINARCMLNSDLGPIDNGLAENGFASH